MQYGFPRAPMMVPWLWELYYTSIPMTLATVSPVATPQSTFWVSPVLPRDAVTGGCPRPSDDTEPIRHERSGDSYMLWA